jgi:two-component system LytT family response regulator
MKVLIVDDEKLARTMLRSFLTKYVEDIEIVGEAGNVPEAIKIIVREKPEVVFLDIEMPGFSGLQLPDFFEEGEIDFHIIFTTAYAKYAVQAFRISAIDYLLKPIDVQELKDAVQKVRELNSAVQTSEKLASAQAVMNGELPDRIVLPMGDEVKFASLNQISFLQAEGAYVYVYFSNGEKALVSKKLGEFDFLLESTQFFKPHRSYIINMKEVEKYVKSEGGYIVMQNDEQIPLSRSRKNDFTELINSMQ